MPWEIKYTGEDEDQDQLLILANSNRMYAAISNAKNEIRYMLKYEKIDEVTENCLEKIRQSLYIDGLDI